MKKTVLLLTIMLLYIQSLQAQEKPFHLKTNLPLWPLTTPNLTLEYQIAPKQSLSLSGYKGEFVFISEMAIQGINLSYRKYFNRQSGELKGFYLSLGLAYFSERYNNHFSPTYGVRTDIGLQHIFKSNIILDAGVGIYWILYDELLEEDEDDNIKPFYTKIQPLLRANLSIGYRF